MKDFPSVSVSLTEKHLNQYDVLKINMQEFLSRSDDVEGMLTLMQRRILSDLKQKYPEYVRGGGSCLCNAGCVLLIQNVLL